MVVGLLPDKYHKKNNYINRYETILNFNGIRNFRLNLNQVDFWDKVSKLDLFIFRWGHYDTDRQIAQIILPIIENILKIKCFPDQNTCWHYDDKIKQYYLLKYFNFPFTESYIFWNKKEAIKWLGNASFPLVFKLKTGAGSKNVFLVKNERRAKRIIKRHFGKGKKPIDIDRGNLNIYRDIRHLWAKILRAIKGEDVSDTWQREKNYVLFQKYLPDNEYDTRITIMGGRAFGFRRKTREKDFRASGSGKIEYDMEKVDTRCIKIAFDVSMKMKFQSMAYDFIYNEEGEPEFCEISYTFDDLAIFNCPGYWDRELKWHEGHFLPQYFQLMDLLNLPNLKQPEIKF